MGPKFFGGSSGISGSFAFAEAAVTAFNASDFVFSDSVFGVHGDGFFNDDAVLDHPFDVEAGVGAGYLTDFVGVHPDFFAAAFFYGCCEAFLDFEITHFF